MKIGLVLGFVFLYVIPSCIGIDDHRSAAYHPYSTKTCSQLQAEGYSNLVVPSYNANICMLADFSTGGSSDCRASATFQTTASICQSLGMRVCRGDEFLVGGGCGITSKKVWLSNGCAAGKVNRAERNGLAWKNVDCQDMFSSSVVAHAHCCADATIPADDPVTSCPENSGRNLFRANGEGFRGLGTCECFSGYEGTYNGVLGLQSCTASTASSYTQCSAGQYAVRSSESCSTLISNREWRQNPKDSSTCAATASVYSAGGDCPYTRRNTWYDAQAYCQAAGGRLCSRKELKQGIHARTGCDSAREHVFSSTPCSSDNSKFYAYRFKGNRRNTKCLKKDALHILGITCCADSGTDVKCKDCIANSTSSAGSSTEDACDCTDGWDGLKCTVVPTAPPTNAPLTCRANEYEWTRSDNPASGPIARRRGDPYVQGMTISSCPTADSWANAKAACEAEGARLCTEEEVRLGETRGTGCGFDEVNIWTSTPCCSAKGTCGTEKYVAYAGKGDKGGFSGPRWTCEVSSANRRFRCCKDVNGLSQCKSCPTNAKSNIGSSGIESCYCPTGFWGRNGGACTAN